MKKIALSACMVLSSLSGVVAVSRAERLNVNDPENSKAESGERFNENSGAGTVSGATPVVSKEQSPQPGFGNSGLVEFDQSCLGARQVPVPALAEEKPGVLTRVNDEWAKRMKYGSFRETDIQQAAELGAIGGSLFGGFIGFMGAAIYCSPSILPAIACGAGGFAVGVPVGAGIFATAAIAIVSSVKYINSFIHVAMNKDLSNNY